MSWFRSKKTPSDSPPIRHAKRSPGNNATPEEIFEVWGDLLDLSDREATEIARLGQKAMLYMHTQIAMLLDDQQKAEVEWCSDSDDYPYLLITWKGLQGELGVRPFGRCLDLFGILIIPKGLIINSDPNPLVRLSKLDAAKRRNVTIFQSLLKYVLDQTGEALDEQRIV